MQDDPFDAHHLPDSPQKMEMILARVIRYDERLTELETSILDVIGDAIQRCDRARPVDATSFERSLRAKLSAAQRSQPENTEELLDEAAFEGRHAALQNTHLMRESGDDCLRASPFNSALSMLLTEHKILVDDGTEALRTLHSIATRLYPDKNSHDTVREVHLRMESATHVRTPSEHTSNRVRRRMEFIEWNKGIDELRAVFRYLGDEGLVHPDLFESFKEKILPHFRVGWQKPPAKATEKIVWRSSTASLAAFLRALVLRSLIFAERPVVRAHWAWFHFKGANDDFPYATIEKYTYESSNKLYALATRAEEFSEALKKVIPTRPPR